MKNSLFILSFLSCNLLISASSSKLQDGKIPTGITLQDAKQALYQELKPVNEKIDLSLIMQADKPQKLYGREMRIDIQHIVNLQPEIQPDRTVSLQGGHMYKVVAALKSQGLLANAQVSKDVTTNCCEFKGNDVITGNQLYKTTFPQGWKSEDIYKAIATSTVVHEEKNGNTLIVDASVKANKNPEFIIKTVSYLPKDSKTYQMVTAYPEIKP